MAVRAGDEPPTHTHTRSPDTLTYRDLELGRALLAPERQPLAAARRHVLLSRPYSTSNHA